MGVKKQICTHVLIKIRKKSFREDKTAQGKALQGKPWKNEKERLRSTVNRIDEKFCWRGKR
jgi:hypothetical protein